jgi:hypothetical protein
MSAQTSESAGAKASGAKPRAPAPVDSVGFIQIPNDFFIGVHRKLSLAARAVYEEVAYYYRPASNGRPEHNVIGMSDRTVAELCGIGKSTTARAFDELVAAGVLTEVRHGSRGQRRATEWALTDLSKPHSKPATCPATGTGEPTSPVPLQVQASPAPVPLQTQPCPATGTGACTHSGTLTDSYKQETNKNLASLASSPPAPEVEEAIDWSEDRPAIETPPAPQTTASVTRIHPERLSPPEVAVAKAPAGRKKSIEQEIPEDFILDDENSEIGRKYNLTDQQILFEFEKFNAHARSHGRKAKDWRAAWRMWAVKAREIQREKEGTGPASPAASGRGWVDKHGTRWTRG